MLEYAPKSEYRHAAFRLVNNFGKIQITRPLHHVGPVVRCKYILVMEIDLKAAVQMGEPVCRRCMEPSNHLSLICKVQEMVGHRRRMGFKGLVGSTFRCRAATGGRAQTRNLISHDRHDRRQPSPFSTSHHHDDHRSSKASTSLRDRILPSCVSTNRADRLRQAGA